MGINCGNFFHVTAILSLSFVVAIGNYLMSCRMRKFDVSLDYHNFLLMITVVMMLDVG